MPIFEHPDKETRIGFLNEGPLDVAAAGPLILDLGRPREHLGFRSCLDPSTSPCMDHRTKRAATARKAPTAYTSVRLVDGPISALSAGSAGAVGSWHGNEGGVGVGVGGGVSGGSAS